MKIAWTKRGIPHGFLSEVPIHLVYRVKDCAPVGELRQLTAELREQIIAIKAHSDFNPAHLQQVLEAHLIVYDRLLDAQDQRKYVLSRAGAATVVLESWMSLQSRGEIRLYAVCVMGNHVHVLLAGAEVGEGPPIGQLVNRHKRYTDSRIKQVCSLGDRVWDPGFYDRYVRAGTFWEVLLYILLNPVKAGLVSAWEDWPHTYVDLRCVAGLRSRGLI